MASTQLSVRASTQHPIVPHQRISKRAPSSTTPFTLACAPSTPAQLAGRETKPHALSRQRYNLYDIHPAIPTPSSPAIPAILTHFSSTPPKLGSLIVPRFLLGFTIAPRFLSAQSLQRHIPVLMYMMEAQPLYLYRALEACAVMRSILGR